MKQLFKKSSAEHKALASPNRIDKRSIFFLLLFFLVIMSVSAESTIPQLDSFADKFLSMINSKWMQAIVILAFIGLSFTLILFGREHPSFIKLFLPVLIGLFILLNAPSIVKWFWKGSDVEKMNGLLIESMRFIAVYSKGGFIG